jgi:hypothetical protein
MKFIIRTKSKIHNGYKNPRNWVDVYGQCYRKIGEFIFKELGDKYAKGWCVTVGETNSHWNTKTSKI